MKENRKYVFAFLLIALNALLSEAQSLESYAEYATNHGYAKVDYLIKTKVYKLSEKDIHAQAVMQDNEIVRNTVGQNTYFASNPLLLNGQMLDYGNFDWSSKGILTVVKGNPESKDAVAVPFFVSIRRNGKIIENKKMPFLNKAVYKINLSDIFLFCKEGDVLIVNPSKVEDWKAKRILKLLGGGC
jgi:hypothetical protein